MNNKIKTALSCLQSNIENLETEITSSKMNDPENQESILDELASMTFGLESIRDCLDGDRELEFMRGNK